MLWSSAKGFESWQSYAILQFFLRQNSRLLNGSIYNHLFSLMHSFTTDNSLRAGQSNGHTLLELSLTCAGEPASWTTSLSLIEIGHLYPSELGQQPALFAILSPFEEALPDCQSLPNVLDDHCLLTLALVNNKVYANVSDVLFCLKWWALPELQLSIQFLSHLLIDLTAFHVVCNHISQTWVLGN